MNGHGAVAVIGGGIAGIQASLDLAESGFKVYLVESKPSIGGVMSQLDKTFPTNDCAMCILSPKLVEAWRNPNIEMLSYSEAFSISGDPGNFKVKVIKKARYVDEGKCTGCGICSEKCPVKVLDEYNVGMSKRKAIYIQFPQAVPHTAIVDREHCLYLTKGICGVCKRFCNPGAINLEQKDEEVELEVGSVILASGFDPYDPSEQGQLHPEHPNVLTALQSERLMSASGPTQGELKRPSDGTTPKKIAFLQCVGSRDERRGRRHCSSVCCTYATKQAIIAKEHIPELEVTIFSIDLRTFGKGFEEFRNRAREKYGIRYINSRPPEVLVDKDDNLFVKYEDIRTGEVTQSDFDLIILSIGLEPSESTKRLAIASAIELDPLGNIKTSVHSPTETNMRGVYVCGAAQSPKDIPDTVAQASAAASKVSSLLKDHRGEMVRKREYPAEKAISREPRVGVFVCHCGGNIGSVVDVPSVVEYARSLRGVAYASALVYACSKDSLVAIKEIVAKHELDRIVVAACTPRTHEPLFQDVGRDAGLNPYFFEMANIREQCSWVHMKEPDKATRKAKSIVRIAVSESLLSKPIRKQKIPVTNRALVLGGGAAGMTAAIDIADKGFDVYLVEREAELGGMLRKLVQLHDGREASRLLSHLTTKVRENERIKVFTNSTLRFTEGYVGNFNATIAMNGDDEEVQFGVAVIATGSNILEPQGAYEFGKNEKVIIQPTLERMLGSGIEAKNIVMIQCVGARNRERVYCSRTCCIEAVKNALRIKQQDASKSVHILYRDMCTYGIWEELYFKARGAGVIFIKYDEHLPPVVSGGTVRVFDLLVGEEVKIVADLIVLSTPMVPRDENAQVSQLFKIPLDQNGFFLEAHPKLRPVDSPTDGIFICGTAQGPKLLDETVSQAGAAASRACTVLWKEFVEAEGLVPIVDEAKCTGCGLCKDLCRFSAITIERRRARVLEPLCRGCGICVASCPRNALNMNHFADEQIISQIDAALEVMQ